MNEAEDLEGLEQLLAETDALLLRQRREYWQRDRERLLARYERAELRVRELPEVHARRLEQLQTHIEMRSRSNQVVLAGYAAGRHLNALPTDVRRRLLVLTLRCPSPAGRTCPLVEVYRLPSGTVAQFITRGGRRVPRVVLDREGSLGGRHCPLATCRHGDAGLKMAWLREQVLETSGMRRNIVVSDDDWRPSA